MRTPHGGHGALDRCARRIHRLSKRWYWRLVGALVLGFPPALITAFYGNTFVRSNANRFLPGLTQFLVENAWWIVAVSWLYPVVTLAMMRAVLERADRKTMSLDSVLRVNAALDSVVGAKEQRFQQHALNAGGLSKESVFCTITRPDVQIWELLRGVWQVFDSEKGDDTGRLVRVVLVELRNGVVTRTAVHFPQDEPVRVPVSVLNSPSSAIMVACRSRRLVVIPSVQDELKRPPNQRRYAVDGVRSEAEDFGSLLCYPVIHGANSDVAFVISIHCDEDGHFKTDKADVYERMLDRFALRIRLEYNLLLMKEALCEPQQ